MLILGNDSYVIVARMAIISVETCLMELPGGLVFWFVDKYIESKGLPSWLREVIGGGIFSSFAIAGAAAGFFAAKKCVRGPKAYIELEEGIEKASEETNHNNSMMPYGV